MTNTNIKRYSLSKQVSDELENMIKRGDYKVGEKIPTEPDLMEMFNVSRNTIREAIKALSWAGILEIKQGDGTYVRTSNRFDANMRIKYDDVSLDDIKEARNCIEVTIARLAAKRREEADIKLITEKFENRQNLKSNIKENTKADLEFHMAIAKASHNVILIDLYESISDYLENHIIERNLESNLSFSEIDELHKKLYIAIIEKNPEAATIAAHNIVNI